MGRTGEYVSISWAHFTRLLTTSTEYCIHSSDLVLASVSPDDWLGFQQYS